MPCLSVAEFDFQFARHRSALEAYARRSVGREDAQDLVSGCYLLAREALAVYRPERSLFAWLVGILDNLLRRHFRRIRIRRENLYGIDTCTLDGVDTGAAKTTRQAAWHWRLCARLAAVDLTARQYECVILALRGQTQQQIGRSMGISQRMAGCHLQAAAERLRDFTDDLETWGAAAFFDECAQRTIYRKPHSFDNQSNSVEREQHRYACLREVRKKGTGERKKAVQAANERK